MQLVFTVALGVALLFVVIWGVTRIERLLLYQPSGGRVAPEVVGLHGVDELVIKTPSGDEIISWYGPAKDGRATVLYFHGNGASLAARAERIRGFTDRGIGIFIMSYRGYSGSTGTPSERANVEDAKLAYEVLVGKGVPKEKIILYGESLGTGVAVQVGAEKPVAGIILDAPYTSIVDVAELCYPIIPSRYFMRDRYETLKHLERVHVPILVIHGEMDRVIPVSMGRAVAAAVTGPVKLVTFPRAGHSDHRDYGSMDVIAAWIGELEAKM